MLQNRIVLKYMINQILMRPKLHMMKSIFMSPGTYVKDPGTYTQNSGSPGSPGLALGR